MSFAKSKNDFSKKDMNFFSEFSSAASQQISSAFPFFLLATVVILVFTLIVWIACGIQIMNKQNRINDLKAEMNDAEYQARLRAKDQSQAEVEELRSYYYVLSTLDNKIASKTVASSTTLETCKDCLPDDTIMTAYDNVDGMVTISGQSISRESALNYLHLLHEKGIFAAIEDKITPFDPFELGYQKDTLMFGNMNYAFSFTCTLKGYVSLTYASFVDGDTPTPLTVLSSQSFAVGSPYSLPKIATYSQDGVDYKLTNVKINGTAVTPERLTEIINSDELSGKISGNTNIELMYTPINGGES
jgi:hypothetical protein